MEELREMTHYLGFMPTRLMLEDSRTAYGPILIGSCWSVFLRLSNRMECRFVVEKKISLSILAPAEVCEAKPL